MANVNIPPFPNFELDDHNTVSIRWDKYKKCFSNLCVALNINDEPQKLASFLNDVGEGMYDIYDSLVIPGTPEPERP